MLTRDPDIRAAEVAAYNERLLINFARMLEQRTRDLIGATPVWGDYCVWLSQRNPDTRSN